eukprot:TRINITY_DN28139_c0_g1_i1.p1 TRINITY_DN28139_c0_g1~~TRINITY_DN28139_c0_g1_i1.p1  ORF type:complete len:200 (-),score=34.83 TRINITY_DN28139_c0_g1_i1:183-782(-)
MEEEEIAHKPNKFKTRAKSPPVQILDWLYLGSEHHAFDVDQLKELQIDYILNVYRGNIENDEKVLVVPLCDYGGSSLKNQLPKCFDFLQRVKKQHKKVLVHCAMGFNRSPTVIIGYLVKHENMTLAEAVELVKSKRDVRPVPRYLSQLQNLEKDWKNLERSSLTEERIDELFPPIQVLLQRFKEEQEQAKLQQQKQQQT